MYEDEAVAFTEAPDTVRGFVRQRFRWMFGTMQAAWKHADILFRPRYGALGFVALPNVLIFQVLFPLISPVMDLLLIGSLASAAFDHWQHPVGYSTDALGRVLFYYALFVTVDYLAAALAFALERKENKWLLAGLFWQRFCYRQLMYTWRSRARWLPCGVCWWAGANWNVRPLWVPRSDRHQRVSA